MKKIKFKLGILLFFWVLITTSCIDEILNKSPELAFSEENTFENFEITQNYALGLYTIFPGFSSGTIANEFHGDLMSPNRTTQDSDWIWNRVIVPASSNAWDFSFIRRVNILLNGVENSDMSPAHINHWKAVGYFFRAYDYSNKLSHFGDVPWIEGVVGDTDEQILFGPRTPRNEVARNVLDDLLFAEEHLLEPGTNNIVNNSIDVDVVRALISRFGLFEGTWRKYHNLSGAEEYLLASAEASTKLIEDHADLHSNFDELFNSTSLAGVPGVLLYKQYETNVLTHNLTTFTSRSEESIYDITKKGADKFLLTDGQTRWNSPLFEGDSNPYDEFRNRDRRMYFTILPPYRVVAVGSGLTEWDYTNDLIHREYIDLIAELSDEYRYLPIANHSGRIITTSPHFRDYDEGFSATVSYTGYGLFKFYNRHHDVSSVDFNDYPVFRMGEVLLNHAEVTWELGEFNQVVADMTINKLRERGGVASMTIAEVTGDFDPTRDSDVDPILWEIRRERAVELMAEGFRFDDLRRWKKMDYTDEEKLGRWIRSEDVDGRIPIQNGADEGYISYFGTPPPFEDYYYLYPIPSDQIALNPEIEQNPGW